MPIDEIRIKYATIKTAEINSTADLIRLMAQSAKNTDYNYAISIRPGQLDNTIIMRCEGIDMRLVDRELGTYEFFGREPAFSPKLKQKADYAMEHIVFSIEDALNHTEVLTMGDIHIAQGGYECVVSGDIFAKLAPKTKILLKR